MRCLLLACSLTLAGCGRDRIETVPVPVPQPCATVRPAPVEPLNKRFPAVTWDLFTPQQKAAHVGAQALLLRNYGDALNAATIACPEAK